MLKTDGVDADVVVVVDKIIRNDEVFDVAIDGKSFAATGLDYGFGFGLTGTEINVTYQ